MKRLSRLAYLLGYDFGVDTSFVVRLSLDIDALKIEFSEDVDTSFLKTA